MPARAQPCSWSNGSSRVFLPRHKSVPDDSCAYHALLGGVVEKGRETWAIPKLPMCEVEAMGMPTGDSMDASAESRRDPSAVHRVAEAHDHVRPLWSRHGREQRVRAALDLRIRRATRRPRHRRPARHARSPSHIVLTIGRARRSALSRPRGSGTSTSRRLATLTADLSSLHRGHDLSPLCARRGAERNDPAKSLTVWYAR